MTSLTTPTETLVRISFEGLTDFQPLALAPGLPMLDVNKLTYQVLLGWFGDVLAEPEPDHGGVAFHVQKNGQRQTIVERRLATQEDLDGPLLTAFENLKKSLFDVRPVSPSERTIFNRLQPPIANHEGFLYRVLTAGGDEQLVWCWGFQRRTQYGDARLCVNPECSMLFLHDELAEQNCPHCGQSFGTAIASNRTTRSKFPVGKVSIAAAAVLLTGGTLWVNSSLSKLSADTVPEEAQVDQTDVDQPDVYQTDTDTKAVASSDPVVVEESPPVDENTAIETLVIQSNDFDSADEEQPTSESPELLVASNDPVGAVVSEPQPEAAESEPADAALPAESLSPATTLPDLPNGSDITDEAVVELSEPESLPDSKQPDVSTSADVSASVVSKVKSLVADAVSKLNLPDALPVPVAEKPEPNTSLPEPSGTENLRTDEPAPSKPESLADSSSLNKEVKIEPESQAEPIAKPGVVKLDIPEPDAPATPDEPVEGLKPALTKNNAENSNDSTDDARPEVAAVDTVVEDTPPGNTLTGNTPDPEVAQDALTWHSDYLTAYSEASREQRYLLMLFHEFAVGDEPATSSDSMFAPSMQPLLEQFVRVELPLNAAMPNSTDAESGETQSDLPKLLLNHRSFRHLGPRPGLAIVDLTDPESPNHARVVSALPMPESGAFNSEQLALLLNLSKGAISQRTLVFTVRSTIPDSPLATMKLSPALTAMAHRNSRYLASGEPVDEAEQQSRQEIIAEEFGPGAGLKELVFTSEPGTSIHAAAAQAVTAWAESPDTSELLTEPATAAGMDMFQSPGSGRWYVTCFVVR